MSSCCNFDLPPMEDKPFHNYCSGQPWTVDDFYFYLSDAVISENYERAAVIRDEMIKRGIPTKMVLKLYCKK